MILITANNFWTWLVCGMIFFSLMGILLGVYVAEELTLLIIGSMGWLAYMILFKAGDIEIRETRRLRELKNQEIANYMKDERLRRQLRQIK